MAVDKNVINRTNCWKPAAMVNEPCTNVDMETPIGPHFHHL